jgi:PAS domain S-box-containing protein
MCPAKKTFTDAESGDVAFRIIANVSPHGVFRVANDGHLVFINQRLCDLFGVRSEQVNNPKSWLRPLHPEDRSAARRAWRMALRERSAWSYECRVIPKDRIFKWLKISLEPLVSSDGMSLGFVGIVEDSTESKRREARKRGNRDFDWSIVDAMPQIVFIHDSKDLGLRVNRRWYDYTGFNKADQASWLASLHPDEVEAVTERWNQELRKGEPYEIEFRFRRADGVYRWHIVHAVPLHDENGHVSLWLGTATDIEDRKQLEIRLRENEERLQLAMSETATGLWDMDLRTGIDLWSESLYRIVGVPPSQSGQATIDLWCSLVHPDDLLRVAEETEHARRNHALFSSELRIVRPDRDVVWVSAFGRFQYDKDDEAVRFIGILRDITNRRFREQLLRDSERRWRTLIDANVVGVVVANDSRIIEVNERFLEMVGYRREDLVGDERRVHLTPDEFAPRDLHALEQLATTGAVIPFEKEFRHKSGARVPALVTGARLDRTPLSWIGFVVDLTERKRAEEKIYENERRWHRLVDSKLFGVVIANEERVIEANKVFLDIVGYTAEELSAGKVMRASLTPPEYKYLDDHGLQELQETGSSMPYEKEYRRRDGTRVPVLLGSTTLTEEPLTWIGFIVDLTEQKRTQKALREGEEQLRALTKASPVFLFTMRQNGECEYASDYYYEFTGRAVGAVEGMGWIDAIHSDDASRVAEAWQQILPTGEPFEAEYRLRRSDGNYRWFKATAISIRDETGKIGGWYGGSIDIHDQKQVQAALRQVDRRKDEFLAMLAHELRNPLGAIVNAVALVERIGPPEPRLERARDVIRRQVDHLTRIVEDLLDATRITTGKIQLRKTDIPIAELVEQCIESASALFDSRDQKLEVDLPNDPMTIHGDPVRLTQVLLNLLSNAAKYTSERGVISLRVSQEDHHAVIRVRDNGCGISPELLPHVFDLFVQGDRAPQNSQTGLGVGLTIVLKLVELHGGQVNAFSGGIGHGSEFVVRLPLNECSLPK